MNSNPAPSSGKKTFLPFLLTLLFPGAGHFLLGDKPKGIALVCMDLGMIVSVWFSHSWLTYLMIGMIYLGIVIPAVGDVRSILRGTPSRFSGQAIPYVIVMLLAVGPFALPLLWQSQRFSKTAKVLWTAAVIVIAVLVILTLAAVGPFLESLLQAAGSV